MKPTPRATPAPRRWNRKYRARSARPMMVASIATNCGAMSSHASFHGTSSAARDASSQRARRTMVAVVWHAACLWVGTRRARIDERCSLGRQAIPAMRMTRVFVRREAMPPEYRPRAHHSQRKTSAPRNGSSQRRVVGWMRARTAGAPFSPARCAATAALPSAYASVTTTSTTTCAITVGQNAAEPLVPCM